MTVENHHFKNGKINYKYYKWQFSKNIYVSLLNINISKPIFWVDIGHDSWRMHPRREPWPHMEPEARSLLVFTSGGPRNRSVLGRSPRPKEVDFAYVCICFPRKNEESHWEGMEMDGNGWKWMEMDGNGCVGTRWDKANREVQNIFLTKNREVVLSSHKYICDICDTILWFSNFGGFCLLRPKVDPLGDPKACLISYCGCHCVHIAWIKYDQISSSMFKNATVLN